VPGHMPRAGVPAEHVHRLLLGLSLDGDDLRPWLGLAGCCSAALKAAAGETAIIKAGAAAVQNWWLCSCGTAADLGCNACTHLLIYAGAQSTSIHIGRMHLPEQCFSFLHTAYADSPGAAAGLQIPPDSTCCSSSCSPAVMRQGCHTTCSQLTAFTLSAKLCTWGHRLRR
jgi:hypothetical protein